ncbi:MAG: O-antigen ligase family protein [Bacilli bacterium]
MMKKNYNVNFIKTFLLSLPLVDATTYFTKASALSISLLLKLIFLIAMFIYVVINYRGEKLKQIVGFLMITILLIIMFLLFNVNQDFLTEFINISKLLILPILLVLLYCIKNVESKWIDWNIVTNIALIYAIITIATIVVGIDVATFNSKAKMFGSKGIYFAGNDVGTILGIGISILMLGRINPLNILKFIIIFTAIAIMGVKTPLIMMIMTIIYVVIRNVIMKKFVKQTILGVLLVVMAGALYIPNSNVVKNFESRINFLYKHGKYEVSSKEEVYESPYILVNELLLSGRLGLLENINEEYIESNPDEYIMGIGYSPYIRSTEMDFFDAFYRLGILGFIVYLILLIYAIKLHIKKFVFDEKMFVVIMILLCGFFVGHVLTAISVTMVLALIISTLDVIE